MVKPKGHLPLTVKVAATWITGYEPRVDHIPTSPLKVIRKAAFRMTFYEQGVRYYHRVTPLSISIRVYCPSSFVAALQALLHLALTPCAPFLRAAGPSGGFEHEHMTSVSDEIGWTSGPCPN